MLGGAAALVNDSVRNNADDATSIRRERAREVLYADCTEADIDWATELFIPQRPGHGRGIPSLIAWQSVESTYIRCRQDRGLVPPSRNAWPAGAPCLP